MTKQPLKPTPNQYALAAFADQAETRGPKTSAYYRLQPQINTARAIIKKWKEYEHARTDI